MVDYTKMSEDFSSGKIKWPNQTPPPEPASASVPAANVPVGTIGKSGGSGIGCCIKGCLIVLAIQAILFAIGMAFAIFQPERFKDKSNDPAPSAQTASAVTGKRTLQEAVAELEALAKRAQEVKEEIDQMVAENPELLEEFEDEDDAEEEE